MELDEIRNKIDMVDDQIAALYVKRMELCKKVGLSKKASGTKTENSLREKQIINRVTAQMAPEIRLYGKQIFNALFDTSKAYQSRIIDTDSPIKAAIKAELAKGEEIFPSEATVACQGVEGAYSYIAAEKMFALSSISCFKDWDNVFSAVEKGMCDFGVLPIENSSAGSVNGVYDLMRKHKFYIVRSIKLRVSHFLLANENATISSIKEIVSHEQAIAQCQKLIKSLNGVKITVCDNTAQAAKAVRESGRNDIACLSSKECAVIYGLKELKADVQDNDGNYTRFITISKRFRIFEGADKISVMVNLPHEAGSLNKLLNRFSALGLNLTKLESRPIARTPFEFTFYFDFEARIKSVEILNLIAELENSSDDFVFLGAYGEA